MHIKQQSEANRKMERAKVIGTALIIIGLLIILHHYILYQRIADTSDILHHEFFEAIFLTAGATLLIGSYAKQRSDTK